jgi:lipid-binding SYLF domain-containing protein
LDGSVIGMDNSANRKTYGNNVTAEDILGGKAVRTNKVVQPFVA